MTGSTRTRNRIAGLCDAGERGEQQHEQRDAAQLIDPVLKRQLVRQVMSKIHAFDDAGSVPAGL